ncbi:MAG: hypothetical protein HY398_00815 [Candidatus Doudnabacteria bacterium]|nr:hypothetical protein [Candidatus Doudnabacteria bacterium]
MFEALELFELEAIWIQRTNLLDKFLNALVRSLTSFLPLRIKNVMFTHQVKS